MRKFRFRLKTLENLRGMELDSLRQQLAQAQEGLRIAEQALLDAREALNNAYDELMQLRLAQADPTILLSLERYAMIMRDQAVACAQNVARRRQELREARERLTAKRREKKVLEKVRERQFAKYSQYVARQTQKEIDEAAQSTYEQKSQV